MKPEKSKKETEVRSTNLLKDLFYMSSLTALLYHNLEAEYRYST